MTVTLPETFNMDNLLNDIRREVVDLHAFFVRWFNGTVVREELVPCFLSHMIDEVVFISPDGDVLRREQLESGFSQAYGTNPDFKIEIRDVQILQKFGEIVLVNYTEWQKGAKASSQEQNARITSALIDTGAPFQWYHIHETWLPENIRKADPFAF